MLFNSLKKYTAIGSVVLLAACGASDKNPQQQGPPSPVSVTVTGTGDGGPCCCLL